MALVPCQTNANPSLSLLGGGGGGGSGPVIVASTITSEAVNVSSITGIGGELNFNVPDGIFINTNPGIGVLFPAAGAIEFQDGNGAMLGVSSINNVPYPPPGAQASLSTITTGGGWFGAARANLNPVGPMTVVPNKNYLASVSLLDFSFLPQPNATDNFTISIADATGGSYLGNFNCAQISTARGTNIERGFSVTGPYEAISTSANFVFQPSSNISCSTFITTVGNGWLTPLN